ncbi:hypothetical protein Aple_004070 [Acrocarpospora pleiomorpha]|uniref:Transposase IS110-like N-terminal domain-containing protein n=1 Tax=Acrocarpospora pleiomorpha TaxID=90975 RepID=A0A5M3X9U6_9ACTN|nr:transposase [Acrocarpospora pleiomorpha]GES17512.1 hypothetical protein Aple_004070 [Acrocarpospora pleiomorpha]
MFVGWDAFHAARPRWGASKSKSDPGDSYKLADYLRTDGHRLARLQPLDEATRNLQLLTRSRGQRHPTAARILARSWLRVVWACWHTNTAYQPKLHTSTTRIPTAA